MLLIIVSIIQQFINYGEIPWNKLPLQQLIKTSMIFNNIAKTNEIIIQIAVYIIRLLCNHTIQ